MWLVVEATFVKVMMSTYRRNSGCSITTTCDEVVSH